MDNFSIITFDFNNEEHVSLLDKLISSPDSKLISEDIPRFIRRNLEFNKNDNITNAFVVTYENKMIGIAFLNYHPDEIIEDIHYLEEIEIGLGLLPEFRGKHLGSLFEEEFSKYLLEKYKNFNEVVARLEDSNTPSKKSVLHAGFIHIKDDEYHYKRK